MAVPTEVDVIVVGGGAAGCVVAGRLAAADPALEILVVESGRSNLQDPEIIKPGMCRIHLAANASAMKVYTGRPSEHLAGRAAAIPVANILGGGSSVNYMMYTRASASDYDDWQTEGWATKDLLPLLRKCENYSLGNSDTETHGFSGPLGVSHGGHPVHLSDELLKAAADSGYDIVDDAQDLKTSNAFSRWAKWINPTTGRRSDAAHGYVHPQMAKNPNLHLLVDSTVTKVILEGGRATAIQYIPTAAPTADTHHPTTPHTITARRLVVLSAGALSTPTILERSGIGSPAILRAASIAPLVDLPGVGTNYQDHTLLLSVFRLDPSASTCDDLGRLDPAVIAQAESDFLTAKGILTTNFVDAGGKIRPPPSHLSRFSPAARQHWTQHLESAPDKPLVFAGMINGFVGNHALCGLTEGRYLSMINISLYPASRGFIHITSPDAHPPADFDPCFLCEPVDLAPVVWSYKVTRELVRRMPSYRGEVALLHPKFPEGSMAAVRAVDEEDLANRTDIVYTEEDDRAIEQFCRERATSTWHGLGTCAMKPRELGGVVDKNLNVYGVEGLKAADLSICPKNVGGNTYSTALVIGEKCAVLCEEYLGIPNV